MHIRANTLLGMKCFDLDKNDTVRSSHRVFSSRGRLCFFDPLRFTGPKRTFFNCTGWVEGAMIRRSFNKKLKEKMVMLTTAEVITGFVVLGGLTLSGQFGSTASETNFAETAGWRTGWRIYSLIDKAGSWMFWCGIGLFLVGFTIGSAILPALFMRVAAVGYLLALAASLPVVIVFVWRTALTRRAPFYLDKIVGYVLLVIVAIIDFFAGDVEAGCIVDDSDYNPVDDIESGYISSGYFNYTTGRWDNGCSEGLYLKDDD